MVRAIHRQRAASEPLRAERGCGAIDRRDLPSEHLSADPVAHGDPQLALLGGACGEGGRLVRVERKHLALGRARRQDGARRDELERIALGEDAGERGGGELADRVARHRDRLESEVEQRIAERDLGDEDGWLRHLGRVEAPEVLRVRLLLRAWEELGAQIEAEQRRERRAQPIHVPTVDRLALVQPLAKPRALRALAREDEHHRGCLAPRPEAACLRGLLRGRAELLHGLRRRGSYHDGTVGKGLAPEVKRVSHATQRGATRRRPHSLGHHPLGGRGVGGEEGGEAVGKAPEGARRLGRDCDHVRSSHARRDSMRLVRVWGVWQRRWLLEHHVHVGAADAKRGETRQA